MIVAGATISSDTIRKTYTNAWHHAVPVQMLAALSELQHRVHELTAHRRRSRACSQQALVTKAPNFISA